MQGGSCGINSGSECSIYGVLEIIDFFLDILSVYFGGCRSVFSYEDKLIFIYGEVDLV